MIMGLGCMFRGGRVVALGMMLSRFVVRFGGMLVVLSCFLVCVVCHDSPFPVGCPSHQCSDLTLPLKPHSLQKQYEFVNVSRQLSRPHRGWSAEPDEWYPPRLRTIEPEASPIRSGTLTVAVSVIRTYL